MAGRGKARADNSGLWIGNCLLSGVVRHRGSAGRGKAWQGVARQGEVRADNSGLGIRNSTFSGVVRHRGPVRPGTAR